MNKPEIIFVGPIGDEKDHDRHKALSPATSLFIGRWLSFLSASFNVKHINFLPLRYWPMGPLFGCLNFSNSNYQTKSAYTLAIPFLRSFLLALSISYISLFYFFQRMSNTPLSRPIFIFYNWHSYYIFTYIFMRFLGARCIVYQADYKLPPFVKDIYYINYNEFINREASIQGLYFPGLIDENISNDFHTREKAIVYAGGYGNQSIIDKFLAESNSQNYEPKPVIHLFGNVPVNYEKNYSGILVHQFVPNSALRSWLDNTYIHLEYRNPVYKNTRYSFPSKILLYASHGGIIAHNCPKAFSPELLSGTEVVSSYYDVITLFSLSDFDLESLRFKKNIIFKRAISLHSIYMINDLKGHANGV